MAEPTELDHAELAVLLDDVRGSAARLDAALDTLTDLEAREPSMLAGWSRGHVITHLARSADVYLWLLTLARTGAEPGPRADAATLDRALREGAERDTADLVADLDRLLDEATAMPTDRWPTLVTALAGRRHPAWYTLHRARRELETHNVDLNLGYTSTDCPTGYVTWALDESIIVLAARGFAVARIGATDLDRTWTLGPTGATATGPGHELLAWLVGRRSDVRLLSDLPLPTPPAWPLPPAPVWA
ncbi:maleylpyruvate isomerase family mycothiol-dependent enzyme [Streptomyces sp. NPDC051993]|uniref:maleylpyruvate isomerase family mycothiol-dependent enzyme n=1 Tax=Streptomyces sp. NPDC051993 TaxID=3155286 RepID=UPI00343D3CED